MDFLKTFYAVLNKTAFLANKPISLYMCNSMKNIIAVTINSIMKCREYLFDQLFGSHNFFLIEYSLPLATLYIN